MMDLQSMLPTSYLQSFALGVSADGSVVAGSANDGNESEATVWTQTGATGLGYLPGKEKSSRATGVSADASVVVGESFAAASDKEAFRWTQSSGMSGLGFLPGGSSISSATDISTDGKTVVGWSDSSSSINEAFRWTNAEGMVGLGDLPGGPFDSTAWGVSADGSHVVGDSFYAAGMYEAFLWQELTGMVGLGLIPGLSSSTALDVSADGAMVVGQAGNPQDGQSWRATVWTPDNGLQLLHELLVGLGTDITGWTLSSAYGVSDDGLSLAGTGINPSGYVEAFVVRFETIPNPSTLWSFGLGFIILVTIQYSAKFPNKLLRGVGRRLRLTQ